MICWNKIEDFHIEEPTALSLGKFDGVHRGHEALIEHLLEKKKEGLKAVVRSEEHTSELQSQR